MRDGTPAPTVGAMDALATSDERARIAREKHDVVAHTLAVIVAQADGGRFAAKKDPATARRVEQGEAVSLPDPPNVLADAFTGRGRSR
jgi:signal transduction histidine kinase